MDAPAGRGTVGRVNGERTGDGGGEKSERVSDQLRAHLIGGHYKEGSRLPPQRQLAEEFGVSRDTVQRVLKDLVSEGWIASRQGSGSTVIKTQRIHSQARGTRADRAITLGPFFADAFAQPRVTLDVFTLTSESLDTHIRFQSERIRARHITPERISVRIMLPAKTVRLPYMRVLADKDDRRMEERLWSITERHTASLRDALEELRDWDAVPDVDFHIRHVPLAPTFKLYLLNGIEALTGPYEVRKRRMRFGADEEEVEVLDVFGPVATLTHYVKDDDAFSQGTVFVENMQAWFNSVWDYIAEDPSTSATSATSDGGK